MQRIEDGLPYHEKKLDASCLLLQEIFGSKHISGGTGEDFCLSIFVPVCALTRQEVLHCGKLHWEHVSIYQQNPIHDETLSIALHEYCILAVGTIMLQHQYGILLSQDNYYSIWIVVQSR